MKTTKKVDPIKESAVDHLVRGLEDLGIRFPEDLEERVAQLILESSILEESQRLNVTRWMIDRFGLDAMPLSTYREYQDHLVTLKFGGWNLESMRFFEGSIEREERDGCAAVGSFIRLADGSCVLPRPNDVYRRVEDGIQLIKRGL